MYAGWVWLFGAELDPDYRPVAVIDLLVEPGRLWPVRIGG